MPLVTAAGGTLASVGQSSAHLKHIAEFLFPCHPSLKPPTTTLSFFYLFIYLFIVSEM
jgi:hypothetical protein